MKLDNNNHSVFLLYYYLVLVVKYRGSHGNLRLWRECKSPQLVGVSGAVLAEAGSFRLYRRGTFTRRIIIFGSLYDKYLYYSQILRE